MATKLANDAENHCVETLKAKRIKIVESGRSAVFLNRDGSKIRKIRVDDCLVVKGVRCDWIISKDDYLDVLVELKGTDVDHAIEQVNETLRFWIRHPKRGSSGKTATLIVCSQYPRVNTSIQRAKLRLARDFQTPLHIRSRNLEYEFSDLSNF